MSLSMISVIGTAGRRFKKKTTIRSLFLPHSERCGRIKNSIFVFFFPPFLKRRFMMTIIMFQKEEE